MILSIACIFISLTLNSKNNKSTLQYNDLDGFDNFSFILYDKTPGGAGHVKRINNEEILKQIFNATFAKANNCTCGGKDKDSSCYGCLKMYKIKDIMILSKEKV